MSFLLVLRIALIALKRNMLRTCLTMLGLIIGVGAVITIVALGSGAHASIEEDVMDAGTNVIIVSAGNWTSGGVRLGMGSSSRLTSEDAHAIRNQVRGVAWVAPSVRTRQQLINGPLNWSASVEGTGVDLPMIRSWPVQAGAFFGAHDVTTAAKVAVIGSMIRDVLFGPSVNPVGQMIRIGSQPFTVVGLLAPKGQSSTGEDQDDVVYVPYTTAQKKLMGVTYLRTITVSAASADAIHRVAEGIRGLLRIRHQILQGEPDDFRVRTLDEIVAIRTRTTQTMTTLLAAIAAVSLIVGGIGVMNIMLVSVTERTREIGVRMATGARASNILLQFNTEALVVCGIGGLIGVALGFSAGFIAQALGTNVAFTATPALLALASALLTGVLFGYLPARKAAYMDPVVALASE